MNFRTTFILLAALILVAGYFVFEDAPEAEEANAVGVDAPWFYTASMEDIQHIAVQVGGAEVAYTSEGPGAWFFDEPHRPPVDLARWGGITLLLGGPQTQRVIAESLEDPAAFGLDDPAVTIDVGLKGDRNLKILLGATTPNGGFFYAQRETDPRLYLVDSLWGQVLARLAIDPPFPPWYYRVPVQRVRYLAVDHDGTVVEFTKDFNGNWRFADQDRTPVDVDRWSAVLPILGGPPALQILESRIDDFAAYGLLEPVTRIVAEVDPPEGIEEVRRPIELEIGAQLPDESGYYAKVVGQPYLLFVDADWYETIRQLAVEPPVGAADSGS